MKKIITMLVTGTMLFMFFIGCNNVEGNAKEARTQNTKKENFNQEDIKLSVEVKGAKDAVITISGIEMPQEFETQYKGYEKRGVPYYWTVLFGDYSVDLMYLPNRIEEIVKKTNKKKISIDDLEAMVMEVRYEQNVRYTDEVIDCEVQVQSTEDSLSFFVQLSKECNVDFNNIEQYVVEIFELKEFKEKKFNLKDLSKEKKNIEIPKKEGLVVNIINERTAEFIWTDSKLKEYYEVSEDKYYSWDIRFEDSKDSKGNGWWIYTSSNGVSGNKKMKIQEMNHCFNKNGEGIGYIYNGEDMDEVPFEFELKDKSMIWRITYPEGFRFGNKYDTSAFDFRDFDLFRVEHREIKNNNSNNIYEYYYNIGEGYVSNGDKYEKIKNVIFQGNFEEAYKIQPIPKEFSTSNLDSENFKPVTTNYAIIEKNYTHHFITANDEIKWIEVKEINLYSLSWNGTILAQSKKLVFKNKEDYNFVVKCHEATPLTDINGIKVEVANYDENTIYFKSIDDNFEGFISKSPEITEKCDKDGFIEIYDMRIYYSEI